MTIPRPINSSPLTIGDARVGNYEWFSGSIDDIRIFNRALSASEVQTFYHEGGWPVLPTITSISPSSALAGLFSHDHRERLQQQCRRQHRLLRSSEGGCHQGQPFIDHGHRALKGPRWLR